MNAVLLGVLLYVVAQLVIGLVVSRRIHTETDYLLAGRKLGYTLATFSIFATWFGAETCLSSAGRIYAEGLSGGSRDPFGYTACLLLMGLVYAVPLWRRRLTTLGDLFRLRYSAGVERLAVLIMVPTSLLWAAAQIRAFGQVLAASSELDTVLAISIAAGVVIAYTAAGGLLADAVTDVVQGAVLLAGLALVFFAVVGDLGGVHNAVELVESHRLSLIPSGGNVLETIEGWATPICGSVIAQELISRILACRSPQVAVRSTLGATGVYLTVGLIPAFLGLVGPRLVPGLEDSEQFLPHLVQRHVPTVLYVVFAGALVSAILSTVDSNLLAASALVSENLVASLRPSLGPVARLRVSRTGVVVFGVIAYALALQAESIFDLVEMSSELGSAGIFTVATFGLFSRFGGVRSAYASLLIGLAVWVWCTYFTELPYTFLPSLGAALLAYLIAGLVDRRTAPAPAQT